MAHDVVPSRRPRRGFLQDSAAQQRFQMVVLAAFALLLALAPLPLGSNRMWAASLVSVWCNGLLLLLLAGWALQPKLFDQPFTPLLRAVMAILFVVTGWIFLQKSTLAPPDWQHPLWRDAAQLLKNQGLLTEPMKGAVAIDPSASTAALVRFLGYAASFWLALLLGQDRHRAHLLLKTIIVAGLAYAAYGFFIEISGSNKVLWFDKRSYIDNMTSTFFNRNSYAAYAGLGLLSSVAYVFHRWRRIWRDSSPRFFWRDFLNELAGREILWAALPVVFVVALVLSASRAGFASCMVGLLVLITGLAINKRMPLQRVLAVVGALLLAGALGLLLGGPTLLERLNGNMVNEDLAMRVGVYELTWQGILTSPWFGHGFGNFDTAFRLYRDASVVGWFQEAHNEYLEMMFDLGMPMALLWFSGIGLLVWACLVGMVKRQRDGIFPVLALAATTQEALHSVLDFSLQIPAIAITYATLLGIGVAQSRSSRATKD